MVLLKNSIGKTPRECALDWPPNYTLTMVCPSVYHAFRRRLKVVDLVEKSGPIANGTIPRLSYCVGFQEFISGGKANSPGILIGWLIGVASQS
jgi:hypothetical protein